MPQSNRRRTNLVDPLQLRHVVLTAACGAVLAVAVGVWSYRTQLRTIERLVGGGSQREALQRGGAEMLWALAGVSVMAFLAVAVVSVMTTRRVAGPVHVLSWFLDLLAEGRYPPPRALRRQDELKGFHAHFLRTIDAMKAREAEHLRHIDDALAAMRGALPRVPELGSALRALDEDARGRRRALVEASPPADVASRPIAADADA